MIDNPLNSRNVIGVIKYPLFTAKAIRLREQDQYSFAVESKAKKIAIKYTIEKLFNVKVTSINTSRLPLKKCRVGKFLGTKIQYKRAIVKLAPGYLIALFDEK
jgi:large subunit ribosomal protein L23